MISSLEYARSTVSRTDPRRDRSGRGGPLAYLGTFLLATVFYGVTLHIAARYVLGTVPVKRAFTIGPVLALVSVVLQRWGPLVVVPFMVAVAYTAILIVYDLDYKLAALVAVAYYTVAVIVGFTILNLWLLLGTAPA
ncbi:hypothetical protein ACFQMM_13925 [Saliphagus sp. GCM10025308]